MQFEEYALLSWLAWLEYELVLFAGTFFIVGALDDVAVDLVWFWLRVTGRAKTRKLSDDGLRHLPLSGPAAVLIPAWQEAAVIGSTIRHMSRAWPDYDMRIYVGCYGNDPATIAAVNNAAADEPRVRLIVSRDHGPTTKADCLNRLYTALSDDEEHEGYRYRMVVMHDAEDMVHPAALTLLDRAIEEAEFVQLPVLPVLPRGSHWIAGHYADEFAEAHGKAMVVRCAIGAGLPGAGVGSAIDRTALMRLTRAAGRHDTPFAADSLTEDYELGLSISEQGGRTMFLRARDECGDLIATRSYFPDRLDKAVRQKTRWLHGIALQGWDRMGWVGSPRELWMRLRDRRGPFTALVLCAAYILLIVTAVLTIGDLFGFGRPYHLSHTAETIVLINLALFAWRAINRFAFTAREYGLIEGILAVIRIPVANVIAIIAARRAVVSYWKTLRGQPVVWDKTDHDTHPANPVEPMAAK